VLILFPVSKELDILLNAGGVSYALQNKDSRPHEEDRTVANFILGRIKRGNKVPALAMADLAMQWNDLTMWIRVIKASEADKSLDVLGADKFVAAWKAFSFEAIHPTWVYSFCAAALYRKLILALLLGLKIS
jgi:hypothetical protein